jgi:hypothetical protein
MQELPSPPGDPEERARQAEERLSRLEEQVRRDRERRQQRAGGLQVGGFLVAFVVTLLILSNTWWKPTLEKRDVVCRFTVGEACESAESNATLAGWGTLGGGILAGWIVLQFVEKSTDD